MGDLPKARHDLCPRSICATVQHRERNSLPPPTSQTTYTDTSLTHTHTHGAAPVLMGPSTRAWEEPDMVACSRGRHLRPVQLARTPPPGFSPPMYHHLDDCTPHRHHLSSRRRTAPSRRRARAGCIPPGMPSCNPWCPRLSARLLAVRGRIR